VRDTYKAGFIKFAEMSQRGMRDPYLIKGNKTKALQDRKDFFIKIKIRNN
jgi:hypothetical protein